MSSRLAFQTQLASIMEVLANAAVAEICKLVDDDYAVVSLQMSQCQRENKALKRKLHLLELKMARGNAERRLRESAMNSSRPKVQISTGGGLQGSSPSTDGAFERQVDVALWSGRAATRDATSELILSESIQRKSPGVELVEAEALVVKEEKVEANMSRVVGTQEDVPLIGDDGVLEHVPRGAVGRRPRLEQHNSQSTSSQSQVQSQSHVQIQSQSQSQNSSSSRGVEVSGSSPLLKCELSGSVEGRHSIQEAVNPPRYVDDGSSVLCDSDKHGNSLVEGFFDEPSGGEGEKGRPSCSYSLAAADFPSTSSTMNGWTHYRAAFALPQPFSDGSTAPPRVSKERLFVCSYCGKAFNRPKKVEIHQRVHTGEKPFSCSTCGKMFSEAGNLRKHQRVHTGEKPYSCGMCGRGFAWIRNLKTHQQKSHPEIYTEEENRGHE
uniref:C2H2-type domain-containing protein n=1 Tax=Stegastes partitus TaxID=144197 RepID=A0A3B5B5B6_9TELE